MKVTLRKNCPGQPYLDSAGCSGCSRKAKFTVSLEKSRPVGLHYGTVLQLCKSCRKQLAAGLARGEEA